MKALNRNALGISMVIAAVLGCSQKMTVVNPPPTDEISSGPVFNGATNQAATPPPPISGGSLLSILNADGTATILAADQEEDVIDVVQLSAQPKLLGTLSLSPGDQPGRMVADAAGRVYVALRGSGAVATIVPTASGASLVARRQVCAAPRGVEYDAKTDSIFVACATGELVNLPSGDGPAISTWMLDRDLRDVVVEGDTLYVSVFRQAEILTVDRTGIVKNRSQPPLAQQVDAAAAPDVIWRIAHAPAPQGGIIVLNQVASNNPIDVDVPPGQSSYGGTSNDDEPVQNGAGGVVTVQVASMSGSVATAAALQSNPVVDVAVAPDGTFETVSIGGVVETPSGPVQLDNVNGLDSNTPDEFISIADVRGAANPSVVVQRRGASPALLVLSAPSGQAPGAVTATIALPQRVSHVDTGFDVFHVPTAAGIACMNCHPEGGDDSHTWTFQLAEGDRVRRTQSLRGGVIQASAPYHWDGDMTDLQMLCDEVFTHRMGGGQMAPEQTPVLARYLNAMPRIPVSTNLDPNAVAKGQAIFSGVGGCTSCHSGGRGTLQQNQNVGKTDSIGAQTPLQVPMLLGVADRAPYMHDGCAATLMDRLNDPQCAGDAHGNTASLSDDDKQNLVQYLESL